MRIPHINLYLGLTMDSVCAHHYGVSVRLCSSVCVQVAKRTNSPALPFLSPTIIVPVPTVVTPPLELVAGVVCGGSDSVQFMVPEPPASGTPDPGVVSSCRGTVVRVLEVVTPSCEEVLTAEVTAICTEDAVVESPCCCSVLNRPAVGFFSPCGAPDDARSRGLCVERSLPPAPRVVRSNKAEEVDSSMLLGLAQNRLDLWPMPCTQCLRELAQSRVQCRICLSLLCVETMGFARKKIRQYFFCLRSFGFQYMCS